MRGKEKKFIVGKKPTKLRIVITSLFALLASYIAGEFLSGIVSGGNYKVAYVIGTFLILGVMWISTVAVCTEHWDISDDYLEFYKITNYFESIKYTFSIFTGKTEAFSLKIKLSEIKKIRIYWSSAYYVSGTIGHPIHFGITLRDGSCLSFESLITPNSKEYVAAVRYLENNHSIVIEDKYNILEALDDSKIEIVEYINNIEYSLKQEKNNG